MISKGFCLFFKSVFNAKFNTIIYLRSFFLSQIFKFVFYFDVLALRAVSIYILD